MIGECLCRQVLVELPRAPEYINICNCRFCRSLGAAWGYFAPDEVTITGKTQSYQRDDIADPWLAGHHCLNCGSTTHYTVTKPDADDRLGVNMRLFVEDELEGIRVEWQDGRQVEDENDCFIVTGRGHIGDGKAF